MADLADVMDVLQAVAVSATSSLQGRVIDVGQGWPLPGDVDQAIATGATIVSIYAVPGTSSDPGQVFDWEPGTAVAATPGLSASVSGAAVTFAGAALAGDVVAVTVRGQVFDYSAAAGDTGALVASALAAKISGASASGPVLNVGSAFGVTAVVGGIGTIAERIFRQRMQFLVVIWAPNPSDRSAVAQAVDIALKRNLTLTMPDGSEAIIVHQGTRLSDKSENEGSYRRDLIFVVTWDTFDTYPGTQVIAPQAGLSVTVPNP